MFKNNIKIRLYPPGRAFFDFSHRLAATVFVNLPLEKFNTETRIMQRTRLTGILTGLSIIAYLLIFYFIDRALLINPFVYWGTLLVAVIGMAYAVRKVRSDQGEIIEKKDALKHAFLVYVIAMAFFYVFYFTMLNYIDPSITELQKAAMEEAGQDTSKIDFSMTFGKAFSGYIISLIGGFLVSFLMASVMKRTR